MSTIPERYLRERLGVCLARLAALKPEDLARPKGAKAFFRRGTPYFECTLRLFHRLGRSDLRNLSLEGLTALADEAGKTLALFQEILSFAPDKVDNPKSASASLIGAVRDGYKPMLERLSPIIEAQVRDWERPRQPRRGVAFAIAFGIAFFGVASVLIGQKLVGHGSPTYSMLANKVLGALH